MSRVVYIELSSNKAFVFEPGDWRLLDELDFDISTGINGLAGGAGGSGAEKTEYVVSLPISDLGIRALDMELSDVDRVREVLPFELEGLILGDPSDFTHDAVMLSRDEDTNRVLAVYMENKKLSGLLEKLSALGIDPKCVTSGELRELVEGLKEGSTLSELISTGAKTDPDHASDDNNDSRLLTRARHEVSEPTLNLRRGRFGYTKEVERAKRSALKSLVLAAAVGLLVLMHLGLKASHINRQANAVERETLTLYTSLFTGQEVRSIKGLKYKAEAGIKELNTKAAMYKDAEVLETMLALQKHSSQELTITELTVDLNTVTLRGSAQSMDAIHTLRGDLESTLHEVKITESGADAKGGTGFTITARKEAR